MSDETEATTTTPEERPARTTTKRDAAPRGVFRPKPKVWAIRFVCGQGHVHEETVGLEKSAAVKKHHDRRNQARDGWCPRQERQQARADAARAAGTRPVTVREYSERWIREHVAIACKPRTLDHYASVF